MLDYEIKEEWITNHELILLLNSTFYIFVSTSGCVFKNTMYNNVVAATNDIYKVINYNKN